MKRAVLMRAAKERSSKKNLKTSRSQSAVPPSTDSPAGRFCLILELGSAPIWDYLLPSDVYTLCEMFLGAFSDEFIDGVSLKAIDSFCVENKTHLGRQCGCDRMRSLSFIPRSDDKCILHAPYTAEKNLPILQIPGGARALLKALVVMSRFTTLVAPPWSRYERSTFVPVVCPLVTEGTLNLCPCTEKDVKQVMNRICRNSGSRFFHEYLRKRGRALFDYLDRHWHGITGSSCDYCDKLTEPKVKFTKYTLETFERIRSNCAADYRPLKAAMTKDLELDSWQELRMMGFYAGSILWMDSTHKSKCEDNSSTSSLSCQRLWNM